MYLCFRSPPILGDEMIDVLISVSEIRKKFVKLYFKDLCEVKSWMLKKKARMIIKNLGSITLVRHNDGQTVRISLSRTIQTVRGNINWWK